MPLLEFWCRHQFAGGFQLDVAFALGDRFGAIFGPSGSGKTSILSMIAGLLKPQEGFARLGDQVLLDTTKGRSVPVERRGVGMVFQDALLFPHLSVEGNLRYGEHHRQPRSRTISFPRVVEVLEIGGLLQRYPRDLSGGEKQRVALGRALLSNPGLLLMDEPLASLDAALKSKVLTYLERIVAEWNVPTLFVTHSQMEVRRAAQWVVVLERGRIVSAGLPDDALGQPGPLGWSNSIGPANLLRLDHVDASRETVMGKVNGQSLSLPPIDPSLRPRFVQFSPSDVVLSRRDVAGISARNHLRGHVCRLVHGKRAVFVAVDIGQIIWAEITPASAIELDLHAGAEVVCLLKTHSLLVVD